MLYRRDGVRLVSMKSGLEGRNNVGAEYRCHCGYAVSMKSGLEGRNNAVQPSRPGASLRVSLKSGLEGRNNSGRPGYWAPPPKRLNEVRPRRPEQSELLAGDLLKDEASQ